MACQRISKSGARDVQERRVFALKRAFQRTLGRKPTLLQQTLIDRAAVMTVRAEAAASDPTVSIVDLVRVDNAAARARQAMAALISEPREQQQPSYTEIMAMADT